MTLIVGQLVNCNAKGFGSRDLTDPLSRNLPAEYEKYEKSYGRMQLV